LSCGRTKSSSLHLYFVLAMRISLELLNILDEAKRRFFTFDTTDEEEADTTRHFNVPLQELKLKTVQNMIFHKMIMRFPIAASIDQSIEILTEIERQAPNVTTANCPIFIRDPYFVNEGIPLVTGKKIDGVIKESSLYQM
jgi:hypothetical protein